RRAGPRRRRRPAGGRRRGRRGPRHEQSAVPAERPRARPRAGGLPARAARGARRRARWARAHQENRHHCPGRLGPRWDARPRDCGRRPGRERRGPLAGGRISRRRHARGPRRRGPVRRGQALMPARLEIEGGVPLRGSVRVSAAKNVALPGGCAIGVRPIDQHLKGLARLGAEVTIENGYVIARASRLKGARIATDLVTVTGTENLMMAAALAEGTTVIENAACEPEVSDLAALLNRMGARIHGAGTARLEIQGVAELAGATHRIVADRIEAGTLIVA